MLHVTYLQTDAETDIVVRALTLAISVHAGHDRKHRDDDRATLPYISHLLGTAAIVLESPLATAEHVAAALLHDSVEDRPDELFGAAVDWTDGPQGVYEQLRVRLRPTFDDQEVADRVAHLVMCATEDRSQLRPDSAHIDDRRANWLERKRRYRETLASESMSDALVSLADNVHNVRALIDDLAVQGDSVWAMFNAGMHDKLEHFALVRDIYMQKAPADRLVRIFESLLSELKDFAARAEPDA